MKVICVMCGRVVREAPPRNETDITPGICEECREGIGSQQRESEVNTQNSWLRLDATGESQSSDSGGTNATAPQSKVCHWFAGVSSHPGSRVWPSALSNARKKCVSWIVGAVLLVLIGGYVGMYCVMTERMTLGRSARAADDRG
jgi:hypothetical protein